MRFIRDLGRSLLLPIAVLPVAAILLRLGVLLEIAIMEQAGQAVFGNLPLIFALGVGIGFAPAVGSGVVALAALVGYLAFVQGLAVIDPSLDTGVIGGLVIGVTAAYIYKRFSHVQLPDFLAFFSGKRLIPILMGLVAVIYSFLFGTVWGWIQLFLEAIGDWIIQAGAIGLFLYGFFNRLLLITGLHHVLNSFIWLSFGTYTDASGAVSHGDLTRFFAGDPQAGYFMSGFFPIMMFALPALCLAFYWSIPRNQRSLAVGLLFSAALTSFLTGITEIIEFMFLFVSPLLYFIHAILTGLALVAAYLLDIRLGFAFSAGFIDFVLNYSIAENPLRLLPLGLVFGLVYLILALLLIRVLRIPIASSIIRAQFPSSDSSVQSNRDDTTDKQVEFQRLVEALGGKENIQELSACITRMRITVEDAQKVREDLLEKLYSHKYALNGSQVQCVLGMQADQETQRFREFLRKL